MPPGVINMLPGDGLEVSEVALASPDLAGIHFTGSTPTFQHLWREVGDNIENYRSYPRIVGETGGKDFIVAHPSADPDVVRTAMIRGAFEFQGQKCSAASRAYVARSVWKKMKDSLVAEIETHHRRRPDRLLELHGRGHRRPGVRQAQGRDRPRQAPEQARHPRRRQARRLGRLLRATRPSSSRSDPTDEMFTTEYFGPILAVHVYEDGDFEKVVRGMESIAPYALTGSIIAQDRRAIAWAQARAAVRGRQLLHQRQAHRRGRRPAALRRRPGQRHQRQGRRRGQPAPLDRRRARSRRRSCRRPTTATRYLG